MTVSPEIAFLPCSYDWFTALRTSFGMLEETASGGVALSPSVILVCRGQGRPRQYILAVWILFVRSQTFLPPQHRPWARYEMDGVPRSFGPTKAYIGIKLNRCLLTHFMCPKHPTLFFIFLFCFLSKKLSTTNLDFGGTTKAYLNSSYLI